MQNLKIKVNNEAESKEAQDLFFELGGEPHEDSPDRCGLVVFANGTVYVDHDYFENHYTKSYDAKEITLAELRDMVHQEQDEPFLTPECTLNDQYAEIEQVRQHRHYFKDVSNLDEIDVYMVLKLFNVTDPCLQHIVKKALCAGQRGHKDLERDLKDILDTAKRAVDINKTY